MKKILIVVDMQNDFIDGSLGTSEAVKIVPNVINKVEKWYNNTTSEMMRTYLDKFVRDNETKD